MKHPQQIEGNEAIYNDDRMCDDKSNIEQPSFLRLEEGHPEELRSWEEDKNNLVIKIS